MKKSSIIIIGITLIIILTTTYFLIFKYEEQYPKYPKICCNDRCFNIEIADTDTSRQLGLMYRESISDNSGMLFIFDEVGTYSFWMKNTLIPLAGIRLDSELKIVDIILMNPCKTQECPSYKPKSVAKYVLEVNQGLISEKGILKIGDSCQLK